MTGHSACGMSLTLHDGPAAAQMNYVLDVRPDMTVWAVGLSWTDLSYHGNGRPRKPRPLREKRQTMPQRSEALPETARRAQGRQGPRIQMTRVRLGDIQHFRDVDQPRLAVVIASVALAQTPRWGTT